MQVAACQCMHKYFCSFFLESSQAFFFFFFFLFLGGWARIKIFGDGKETLYVCYHKKQALKNYLTVGGGTCVYFPTMMKWALVM